MIVCFFKLIFTLVMHGKRLILEQSTEKCICRCDDAEGRILALSRWAKDAKKTLNLDSVMFQLVLHMCTRLNRAVTLKSQERIFLFRPKIISRRNLHDKHLAHDYRILIKVLGSGTVVDSRIYEHNGGGRESSFSRSCVKLETSVTVIRSSVIMPFLCSWLMKNSNHANHWNRWIESILIIQWHVIDVLNCCFHKRSTHIQRWIVPHRRRFRSLSRHARSFLY